MFRRSFGPAISAVRKQPTPQDTEMDVLGIRLICVLSLLSLAAGFSVRSGASASDGLKLSIPEGWRDLLRLQGLCIMGVGLSEN